MNNNDVKERSRAKVETELANAELAKSQNILSQQDLDRAVNSLKNLRSLAAYTPEEENKIKERLVNIGYVPTFKAETGAMDKVAVVKKSIFTGAKVKIATAITGVSVLTASLYACSGVDFANVTVTESVTPSKVGNEEELKTRDDWNKELVQDITEAFNNEIENGLPLDMQINDENNERIVKSFVEYYLINQMDVLTDEEWANIFQNSTVTDQDLIDAKYAWEWIDEQRVIVSQNHLDYKLMFNETDGEFLNEGSKLLNDVKSSSRSQASIDAFRNYVIDNLRSDDTNIKYSERALDAFRAIHFDAFDELTNHAVVDDELEHVVNTTYTCANPVSDLDVADKTIESLQSEYQTYIMDKLNTRLQTGWNYVALNRDSINEKNDISYMVTYVMKHMDLSKQFVLADLEETLNAMFLTNVNTSGGGSGRTTTTTTTTTTGSGTPSKVDDGQGGKINKDQLDKYGIDENDPEAKEKLEKAVEDEEEKKSIENATITEEPQGKIDEDGEVLSEQGKQTADDYSDGWNDAVKGKSKESGRSAAYNKGYSEGKEYREDKEEKYEDKGKTTESFESVSNGSETTTETPVETQNYTEEEFIPVEETTEEVEEDEITETQDVQQVPTSKKLSTSKKSMSLASTVQGASIAADEEAPAEIVEESDFEEYGYEEDEDYSSSEAIAELRAFEEELLNYSEFEEFESVDEYEDNGKSL